jgi:hypothetical protein
MTRADSATGGEPRSLANCEAARSSQRWPTSQLRRASCLGARGQTEYRHAYIHPHTHTRTYHTYSIHMYKPSNPKKHTASDSSLRGVQHSLTHTCAHRALLPLTSCFSGRITLPKVGLHALAVCVFVRFSRYCPDDPQVFISARGNLRKLYVAIVVLMQQLNHTLAPNLPTRTTTSSSPVLEALTSPLPS